jgi:hypothetical protein
MVEREADYWGIQRRILRLWQETHSAASMSDPAKAKFQSCFAQFAGDPPVHPVKNSIFDRRK